MPNLGVLEILILALFLIVPAMVIIRVLQRNRRKDKPSEDEAGW